MSRHDCPPANYNELSRAAQLRCIRKERTTYLSGLSPPDSNWPLDVRVVMTYVNKNLFVVGLTVKNIRRACGVRNKNISSRFGCYVGQTIKAYVVTHRIELAKRLLRYDKLKIIEIALAVGYDSHCAFTETFHRHEGCPPSEYREMLSQS